MRALFGRLSYIAIPQIDEVLSSTRGVVCGVVWDTSSLCSLPCVSQPVPHLSEARLPLTYAGVRVANSSSSLPYILSRFLPSVSRLPGGDALWTFLLNRWRTGWMVGRHAQIMPRLTSTLDQIVEAVDSSGHMSVLWTLWKSNLHCSNRQCWYSHEKSAGLMCEMV